MHITRTEDMTEWYNVDCRNTHKDDSTKKKNIDRGKAIPKPTIKLLETYLHVPRNEYNLIIRFEKAKYMPLRGL